MYKQIFSKAYSVALGHQICGDGVWLPPMYCIACCASGSNPRRMPLSFVRNPYCRFASAYSWISGDQHGSRMFISRLYKLWLQRPNILDYPNTLQSDAEPLDGSWRICNFADTERCRNFTRGDLFHFRPAHLELVEVFSPRPGLEFTPVRAVHLESLEREWPEVLNTLCRGYGFCDPLPPVPHLGGKAAGRMPFAWDEQSRRRIKDMYAKDFCVFGYDDSLTSLQPIMPEPALLDPGALSCSIFSKKQARPLAASAWSR